VGAGVEKNGERLRRIQVLGLLDEEARGVKEQT
jgi:hypothetical protein